MNLILKNSNAGSAKNRLVFFLVLIGISSVAAWLLYAWLATNQGALPEPTPPEEPRAIKLFSYDSITSAAVAGDLHVSDCSLNPQVLATNLGAPITLKNDSDVDSQLLVTVSTKAAANPADSSAFYLIPSKTSKVVNISFKDGPGRYAYNCLSGSNVGYGVISVSQ